MLRFIVKCSGADINVLSAGISFHTLDLDVPELEEMLRRGGSGPSGFECYDLVGVELRTPQPHNPK